MTRHATRNDGNVHMMSTTGGGRRADSLRPGETFVFRDTTVTVLRRDPETKDRFGRRMQVLWCRREDTGEEGRVLFGLEGIV